MLCCMQTAGAFLPLIFELMMCILTSIAALQFGVRRGYEMISFEVFALMEFSIFSLGQTMFKLDFILVLVIH